jgi:hypothetical protein
MKAIINSSTKQVFYLFEDGVSIVMDEAGMKSPLRVIDMKSTNAEIINIDAPAKWVPGGVMSIVNGAWVINDQTAYDAYEVPTPDLNYKIITKQQALDMVVEYGEMDQAAELAFMKDPNLELFWLKWDRAVPYADINRNSPKVPEFLGAVVATGHITQAQADAIMANWPTE